MTAIKTRRQPFVWCSFFIGYLLIAISFCSAIHPWGELAKNDLIAIKNNLKQHSAPAASKDTNFDAWLEKGFTQGLSQADQISTYEGHKSILHVYIQGFHEGHIELQNKFIPVSNTVKYPGILLKYKGNDFIVGYKDETNEALKSIPLGAKVTTIDGKPVVDFAAYYSDVMGSGNKEADMIRLAPYFLVDQGDPFFQVPKNCTVNINGKDQKLSLLYGDIAEEVFDEIKCPLTFAPPRPLSLQEEGQGAWISVPSFFLSGKSEEKMINMLSTLSQFRQKEWIVFDLRGNEGGASIWQRALIRNLYGDAYLKSLGNAHDYNQPWVRKIHISPENFEFFKDRASPVEIDEYEDARKKGEEFYTETYSIYEGTRHLYSNEDMAPVHAKIFILTDGLCYSSCWHFVHEMLQIPGVTHVGYPIGPYIPYGYSRPIDLPSGLFRLLCPIHKTESPQITSSQSIIEPHFKYIVNWNDRAEVEQWVLDLIKSAPTKH